MIHFLELGLWNEHRDVRRHHVISLGFSGHYQDLGLKRHDSARLQSYSQRGYARIPIPLLTRT